MEESDNSQQAKRCPCGFWGSSQTSGLCSKCYKATVQEKSQDTGLDAKSELLRNRQSAYGNHESVGATSSSYLSSGLTPPSASTMEKAEELLRQAVKNSTSSATNIDNSANILPVDETSTETSSEHSKPVENTPDETISDSKQSKDTSEISVKDTASVNQSESTSVNTDSSSESTIDQCANTIDVADSSNSNSGVSAESTDATTNPVPELLSPEKRGMKRDSSALELDSITPESTPEKVSAKSKKRCAVCKCKLELAQRTIGRCRCDNVYCSLHRLPELHHCDFDHKEDGRREAREKMVKPTRHLGTSFKRLDSDS